ncbi:MAG TPA: hypothetical protein VFI88_08585 [Sphingomicrobium sp.]|jgi:hypothetical protein|nr:hypothetical protein [Sphingomicrobium sp.]
MDSYRDFPSEFEPAADAAEPEDSFVSQIGTDERRMHVRAYNYWVSLLDGRDYPSIEDLEPGDLSDFAPHSVLLDFTSGGDAPATPYVGAAIRQECGIDGDLATIADVPSRSLLSRLTDHYMQIIANRAPVGFEAEFENQRSESISYRGILMPFSSDGDTIDFIYGVINWKKGESAAPAPAPVERGEEPLQLTEPLTEAIDLAFEETPTTVEIPDVELDDDAGLADRLWAARESAEAVRDADGRSREALYRALSRAYDFALVSKAEPEDYAELLEESGVKAQARAPMTPVVKLVFGIDYDKARLTEYSAALSYAERQEIALGGFLGFIEAQAGGLKALVAAERLARRPQTKPDTKTEKAREQLRSARAIALDQIRSEEEFALVLTRRSGDGSHQAVALVDDPALVERAIRKAAV